MRRPVGICGLVFICFWSCSEQTQDPGASQGTDCSQIKYFSPDAQSGVYRIQPVGLKKPVKVYCEMLSDGGWTVFQRRSGRGVSFNKEWRDYRNGFGDPTQDYWLGLRPVYLMTKNKNRKWTLRVDLWDHDDGTVYAAYSDFRLGNEKNNFKLHVGSYQGDAGDAIRGAYSGIDQNGFGFTTSECDNDGCCPCISGGIVSEECADFENGGWWFSSCGSANLNGKWHPRGDHIDWASGLYWKTWKPPAPYSAKASRMMIKSSL